MYSPGAAGVDSVDSFVESVRAVAFETSEVFVRSLGSEILLSPRDAFGGIFKEL